MTPSSSFVKFSVAPVAQGAWLGSPAVRRERVRRAAAGDAGPTTGSSKRMGGVGVCWHRRRNASRTTRTWDSSSARTHAYLRFADARRVVPGQKGCCQSSPVFPPLGHRPPRCMRSAIPAYVSLSANAIPVTSSLNRPSGTISAFSSSSSSFILSLFINSCFLGVPRSLLEECPSTLSSSCKLDCSFVLNFI